MGFKSTSGHSLPKANLAYKVVYTRFHTSLVTKIVYHVNGAKSYSLARLLADLISKVQNAALSVRIIPGKCSIRGLQNLPFTMKDWRQWLFAGHPDTIQGMSKIHQYTILCAPITAQHAAIETLTAAEAAKEEMVTT